MRVTVLRSLPDGTEQYVEEDIELPAPPPPPPPPLEAQLAAILQEMASLLAEGVPLRQVAQRLSELAHKLSPKTDVQV